MCIRRGIFPHWMRGPPERCMLGELATSRDYVNPPCRRRAQITPIIIIMVNTAFHQITLCETLAGPVDAVGAHQGGECRMQNGPGNEDGQAWTPPPAPDVVGQGRGQIRRGSWARKQIGHYYTDPRNCMRGPRSWDVAGSAHWQGEPLGTVPHASHSRGQCGARRDGVRDK